LAGADLPVLILGGILVSKRDVCYMGKTQSQIDGWPQDVREMVNTNL
tara:strand:- start:351 stop:491 length:141 start_codon:yes stop_codon:yes gene_type:complete